MKVCIAHRYFSILSADGNGKNKTKRRGGIKMYKVLYIGFLTFQLISVFCNLKSLKKDILEAHNSRKFNIIGIVCQIIAVIFIMIILKMQG